MFMCFEGGVALKMFRLPKLSLAFLKMTFKHTVTGSWLCWDFYFLIPHPSKVKKERKKKEKGQSLMSLH